ncbi:hypothetical protein LI221_13450 [Faecalimonas umbilicata]|nr:hypothetical protein [Faecalimonas umbilicata]
MSKNSCIAAEKHRRCVLRMARDELLYDNDSRIVLQQMKGAGVWDDSDLGSGHYTAL